MDKYRLRTVSFRSWLFAITLFPIWLFPIGIHPQLGDPASPQTLNWELSFFAPDYMDCNVQNPPIVNSEFEQKVVELVNAERAANGLPPLKRIDQLDIASRYHAADMEQDRYFEHDSYDRVNNQLQKICQWSTRLEKVYTNWATIAENIAWGYSNPDQVMQGWMDSPGHRANILGKDHWEIGVGYYNDNYWVQDFGRRFNYYPVVINSEAVKTSSRMVTLYLYGSWNEVRLRNNSDPWSDWLPFQNVLSWQLPNQPGEHTVYAEMRTSSQSTTSSDTILLTTGVTQPVLNPLPSAVNFFYSIEDQRLAPSSFVITPMNGGDETVLQWRASKEGEWFTVSPTSGQTPDSLTITPSGFDTTTPRTYTGTVTVAITSPDGVAGTPQKITLNLEVTDRSIREIYLPFLISRN